MKSKIFLITFNTMVKINQLLIILFFLINIRSTCYCQNQYQLNSGWKCTALANVKQSGNQISLSGYPVSAWMDATVPGTVLTTLLNNKLIADPFYGMNNAHIPDIYSTGRDYYTYWFVKDFKENAANNDQVWLHFRGINYSCNVYLNGHLVNAKTHKGMFLSQTYNITSLLSKDGNNRLAVIVFPPDVVGNPNGGQGGDGTIARNVSHQYVAGWDWIQPIRDRNTGIWDKVFIEKTKSINIKDPQIISEVPGIRLPNGQQQPAIIKVSTTLQNPTTKAVSGILQYQLQGNKISKSVTVAANSTKEVSLNDLVLKDPKLWWPSNYGQQYLYDLNLQFLINGTTVSDEEKLKFGIREITATWNNETKSKQVSVNGQKIFIKGGNWIISDEMLRFSEARYDAEIRFHRDMNLNLIRVWGGAITERPEFYEACDKYGILVMQDLWGSGDCNGRWEDPMKLDDQWTRRNYPDDHNLFLESVKDQVKLIRNHASLAIWCGGNEITLPSDIFHSVKDSIMPMLDNTRWFIDYSNSDSMSYNSLGGNGDGPYGIQPIKKFFDFKTYPFNSEIGSVGIGDCESLKRFMPEKNMVIPTEKDGREDVSDSIWTYHKYIGYGNSLLPYGKSTDIQDFAQKAQLVNYDQYRALMEGFSAHMWDWYTGVIIWKTQNPWTAMRGQMYDYYLDPNACLYGLHTGSEALHIFFNAADSSVMVANNTFETHRDMMLQLMLVDMDGKEKLVTQVFSEVGPTTAKKYLFLKKEIHEAAKKEGAFLVLRLLDINKKIISDNLYWLADAEGNYSGLQKLKPANLNVSATVLNKGKIGVKLSNPANGTVAFFNRLSLLNAQTHERLLPVFYSDNYVSVLPGEERVITLDYTASTDLPLLEISGWNVPRQLIKL